MQTLKLEISELGQDTMLSDILLIETSLTFPLIQTHCNFGTNQYKVSLWVLTFLGIMTTLLLQQKLLHASFDFYSEPSTFTLPLDLDLSISYTKHKFAPLSKHSLGILDTIQKRAIRLIEDPALTSSLFLFSKDTTLYSNRTNAFGNYIIPMTSRYGNFLPCDI